jgi:hypothetical protein
MVFYTHYIVAVFSTIFVHLFVVKENLKIIESFNKIGPWITLGLICAIIIFFCGFFIAKLINSRKPANISGNDEKVGTIL